ncbi:PREDICTED: uncharacterized protein LOC106314863 [Brassica oleracea var. oleracea]|uniref:uncharacterized protein LOC106314863 n=1 Tax=Brassica oleracea var. oleracea TaxID=109376 RepID=UPI0006A75527|nr:PREDICTED: uncharacterized protein LOC106314863 [Brassica oleracea var. oleracea]
MDASLGMDDDEFLIRQVEAVNASFGLNSQTAEGVQGSKDKDSGAAVDGVNTASGNMLQQEKQKSFALGTVVENGSKKRAHVEAAEDAVCGVNPDNMHQQNCTLQEKEKSCGEGTVVQNGSSSLGIVNAMSRLNALIKQCTWRVCAKQVGDSPTYFGKKASLGHQCKSDVRGQYKKHGTSRVLAALLRSKYERLHCGPRAMELPEVLRTEFNYTCAYWKAWKAKELAIASAQGTEEMSYKMLPQYLHVLKLSNPRTITDIKTELDKEGKSRFLYAFMSLKACIDGWQHLRKVLVVDGTHMFGKYKGVLLSASGQDAYCRVFPIAFAVVDSENSDSWKWFFERCAAIFAAKDKWYPSAHHGICLEHLKCNVGDKYKGLDQKHMVARAAEAFKVSEFQKIYDLIKLTDWRCWDYLEKIDKKLWSRSHFEGTLNKALLPARDSPIMALLEFIRRMLTRWFECRRYDISKMQGNIPKIIDELVVE